jgi:glycosyltransferase A (GT-A) superfamily protein (DUF2064 family)
VRRLRIAVERMNSIVAVIPAFNEAPNIGRVVRELRQTMIDRVIVVDGASVDGTVDEAVFAGAEVVVEPRKGYGIACVTGIRAAGDARAIVFLDGDGSDDGQSADRLIEPVVRGDAHLTLGRRHTRRAEPGAIAPAAVFGNALASVLIRVLYGSSVHDLAPFKAVRGDVVRSIDFRQLTYGWTTELIVTAARRRLRIAEVDVRYRRRGSGVSKVSGTVRGSVLAGVSILSTIRMPVPKSRLMIVAKAPVPGIAKTRIAATIGDVNAADLARAFLEDTVHVCRRIPGVSLGILCPDAKQQRILTALFPDIPIETQGSPGLLAGLEETLNQSLCLGFDRTVIVNSDSPTLPPDLLREAFRALRASDLVFGPADDGGYFLVGSSRQIPQGVVDGEGRPSDILRRTIDRAKRNDLNVAMTGPWFDVDTEADLDRVRRDISSLPRLAPATAATLESLRVPAF